jgi:protein gp37
MEMENSRVEWTGRAFNPWIGYQHMSPACTNCYAGTMINHRLVPTEWRKDLFALIRKDRGQQTIMKINRGLLARHLFAGVTSISAGRKKKEI